MKKCLFCEKELTSDMGYITDGKIDVCMLCAGRYTLNEVYLRVASYDVDSNIQRVFTPAFEANENGLTGQTDTVETDVPTYTRSDGFIAEVPASVIAGVTSVIAGVDSITDSECELVDDIENLSEEDFMSKYTDNPSAIDSYMEFHKLGVYADEPDESGEKLV